MVKQSTSHCRGFFLEVRGLQTAGKIAGEGAGKIGILDCQQKSIVEQSTMVSVGNFLRNW